MPHNWEDDLRNLYQDLFDLMANQPVKIVIEGEIDNVDGTLYLRDPIDHAWSMAASALSQTTADECLTELVRQTRAQLKKDKARAP